MNEDERTDAMPDPFDRMLGQLEGLPDVLRTRPTNVQDVPPLGVGGSNTFIVQSVRQKDRGDIVFLQVVNRTGTTRIVIPTKVANLIARQRESLQRMARRKAGKERAENDKALGIVPGFLRRKAAIEVGTDGVHKTAMERKVAKPFDKP